MLNIIFLQFIKIFPVSVPSFILIFIFPSFWTWNI